MDTDEPKSFRRIPDSAVPGIATMERDGDPGEEERCHSLCDIEHHPWSNCADSPT